VADNKKFIITSRKIIDNRKLEEVKNLLTSINENFKVDNISSIDYIVFDFDIETPQQNNFDFPNDIATYTASADASVLEIFNNIIWLYLNSKEDFKKKLKQFDDLIQQSQDDEEKDEKYDHLFSIVDQIEILDKIILDGDCIEKNFREFHNNFYAQYVIDLI
jgi:hypothetical protein